ncbi:endoplasmic reticulum aminopeptidase 1 [Drosophila biarmipes]|uniref:endoplasmic reticulum aminopeptidase 1 n=1 Tax=Drosophila biarmipes TaxID=125945 RepID=UPI0007E7A763|nr:endoplasmic reticulum aminopeptidase 1 [Drosophila biarmipes]
MITPPSGVAAASGALLVTLALVVSGSLAAHPQRERSLRLPNDTYPTFYQLHISSDIHKGVLLFSGNATIDVAIRRSTNEIVMHAKNLSDIQITVHRLTAGGSQIVDDLTHTLHQAGAYLIIHPREDENHLVFEEGQQYRLEILYTATMTLRPAGLYYMDYKDEKTNRTSYIAATQSEPTYARLIFPCYDEPGFKSNFSITITHGSSHSAISNMPVKEVLSHGELKTTFFQTTPPVSTYLVAFVISDFESISETYRGVTQSIYTPSTIKEKGQRAMKNAVRTVAAIEDYFGVSYPLPKLDHVALKKNYGAAMENWGLITYKDHNLLHLGSPEGRFALWDKVTQNHEIAHQWFGNLVSPEWWTYTWMNEGFATYFSYVITDMLYPDGKVMDAFITLEADSAYSYNSFFDVRPMSLYVEGDKDIMAVFDIISYKRAACVIKMFHNALRQKVFVRGISHFLEKYHYSVANELNLFDALQAEVLEDEYLSQQPWASRIRDIMLSWTHSEWLPIVKVSRNYENNSITFAQRSVHSKDELWWIPLNFATSQSPSFEDTQADIFMPPQPQYSIGLEYLDIQLSGKDWIIVNKQATGFYLVHYDTDNLMAIARQLQTNHSVIHRLNRASLFRDLKPLIEHNEIEQVELVFEMLKYLEFEDDSLIWNEVGDSIECLRANLFGTSSQNLFNEFVRRLVSPIFRRTFVEQSFNITLDASLGILQMACSADLPECLEYTRGVAKDYIINKNNFSTDLEFFATADTLLCMGARYLSDRDFHSVIDLLQEANRESVYYEDLVYGLRCTQSHRHLLYYLEVILGENSTHVIFNEPDNLMYLLYIYKNNLASRPVIWQYVERNYRVFCRSPNFLEHFKQLAGFVPRHQRTQFVRLRQNIADYMKLEGLHPDQKLIESDSPLVGKKVKMSENFQDKFGQQIHNWLLGEIPQSTSRSDALLAASLSASNGSSRNEGILKEATRVLRSALRIVDMYR